MDRPDYDEFKVTIKHYKDMKSFRGAFLTFHIMVNRVRMDYLKRKFNRLRSDALVMLIELEKISDQEIETLLKMI